MAAKKTEGGFDVDVTPAQLATARARLAGRLRNAILEMGSSTHNAGDISGLASDIMTLDGCNPIRVEPSSSS